jgi:hypothetical protein
MTVEQAKKHVAGELARIERDNPDGELRPWHRDACPAALEHWGRVQQRIALAGGNLNRACLGNLDISPPGRSEAQNRVAKANAVRLNQAA